MQGQLRQLNTGKMSREAVLTSDLPRLLQRARKITAASLSQNTLQSKENFAVMLPSRTSLLNGEAIIEQVYF